MKMRHYQLFCAMIPALILAMCQAESHSARLTAFGKSQNQNTNHNSNRHSLGRTRECKSDTDCNGIQNTTCMSDPRDNKMRCLCRDSSAPINGACPNRPRALRAQCSIDTECLEGAECKSISNSTIGSSTSKMCVCREEFVERDGVCSNAISLVFQPVTVVIGMSLTTQFILRRRFLL